MDKITYEIVKEVTGNEEAWFAREKGGLFVDGTYTRMGQLACKALLERYVGKREAVVEEVEL